MLWVHVLGIVNSMLVLVRDRGAIYMLLCLHTILIYSCQPFIVVFIKKYYPLNSRLWLLFDVDFILVMMLIDI
jgi:hypothetical protein